ncbi:hemerythrin domain-containing protein [Paenibacillus sp. LMG 31456]|uniref:Hemerythrin domain-containing protein n=1 Tax=Paenibacillus foliorum TaxID=2654974 RepID=A0A972GS63_9BACL|nr:hemerythrin domain-containing protein [Paenibacillus foliorum]NOU91770.1 hemerythrin domain-containing protein [Paenibacillus foliorum]
MKEHMSTTLFTTIGHPLYELNEAVQRLEEEHVFLQEQLSELYGKAKAIGLNEDVINWGGALRDLRNNAAAFQRDLEGHMNWEEEAMFPMIAWYFGEELQQFTLMEQEHELAELFIDAYLEAVEGIVKPVDGMEAREMASYLLQAHAILNNHFRKEKEIITAMTDRSNNYGGF